MSITPEQLAERFADTLREWLTADQWQEMLTRNSRPEYRDIGACASHDFCDANEAMLFALESLDNSGDGDIREGEWELMNKAWGIAASLYIRA